jgi:hypothetical protein
MPVRLLVLLLGVCPTRTRLRQKLQLRAQLSKRLLDDSAGSALRLQLLQPLPPALVQLLRKLRSRVRDRCRARAVSVSALRQRLAAMRCAHPV